MKHRFISPSFISLCCLASSLSTAGELMLANQTISTIKSGDGQVAIYLNQNFVNTACGGESRNSLIMLESDPSFSTQYASLLTALASNKQIGIWTNKCRDNSWGSGWPHISVIYLYNSPSN